MRKVVLILTVILAIALLRLVNAELRALFDAETGPVAFAISMGLFIVFFIVLDFTFFRRRRLNAAKSNKSSEG